MAHLDESHESNKMRKIKWQQATSIIAILILFLFSSARADEPEVLFAFNGKNLHGFSSWLEKSGREDPGRVFRVEDSAIHVTGDGNGYLATDREFRDFYLIAEYRWGRSTDGGKYVRNSGILMHATGPDGNAGGKWMASVECQLAQGCVGDLIAVQGKDASGKPIPVEFQSDVTIGPDDHPRWKEGGTPRKFTDGQLWWSKHDPDFKELLDTRGKDDVESPLGEWTRVECLSNKGQIEIRVNGVTVNKCREANPSAGKILIQSEGFELFVRKFEVRSLEP
jgi:hypothetical protein